VVRTISTNSTNDVACVVPKGRRSLQTDLLEALQESEIDVSGLSVEDQIKYHETLVGLLDSILNEFGGE
jgi:hypothetical protein